MNNPELAFDSMTIDSKESLQKALHSLIPISAHMGMQVDSYDGTNLVIRAPLANNINHQQSAFGGSLFSVSALAGWGIIQLKLAEMKINANTVVAGGEVSFSKPVFEELVCRCSLPENYSEFANKLQSTGKSSLTLQSNILLDGQSAMACSSKYVVLIKR